MAKATHQGTCQCCGNYQKLPNGTLSNHGYTVQWNMFEGTCPGSKELPFEKDISLVKGYIKNAKENIKRLTEEYNDVISRTDSKEVYHYIKNPYTHSGLWEQRELVEIKKYYNDEDKSEGYYLKFEWVYTDKELKELKENNIHYRHNPSAAEYQHFTSLEQAVKFENEKYAKKLVNQTNSWAEYIRWQEDRIKDWKPSELEEIKETYNGPKLHLRIHRDLHLEDGKLRAKVMKRIACGRGSYIVKLNEFRESYSKNPDMCCKGCTKYFLELEDRIAKLKEVS